MENNKKLYIFHHNDMDGYGALFSVMLYYDLPAMYDVNHFRCINYESDVADKFASVEDESDVWIVDYSFTESTLSQLTDLVKRCDVTWIDHHDSSINLVSKYIELNKIPGIRSKCMSGAALAWLYCSVAREYYVNHINHKHLYLCPKWIQYISDYDTWTHEFKGEEDFFKIGWDTYKNRFKLMYYLANDNDRYLKLNEVLNKGKTIKEFIDTDNERYCKSLGYESKLYDGTGCFVINKRSNSWIFGERINKYPVCVTAVFNGIEWSYSLFSTNKDIDCSKYAEYYGGGGHKGAAGFRSKENVFVKA